MSFDPEANKTLVAECTGLPGPGGTRFIHWIALSTLRTTGRSYRKTLELMTGIVYVKPVMNVTVNVTQNSKRELRG